jgi:osmotically-inducible protein OsmY
MAYSDEQIKKDIVDQVIAEDIVAAFDRNAFVDADSLDVEVENGKVTLSGAVPYRTAYRTAVDIARNTPGVVDIVNDLVLTQ